MNGHNNRPATELETILEADRTARLSAANEIQKVTKTATLLAEK
jgi:hypothetical protein